MFKNDDQLKLNSNEICYSSCVLKASVEEFKNLQRVVDGGLFLNNYFNQEIPEKCIVFKISYTEKHVWHKF